MSAKEGVIEYILSIAEDKIKINEWTKFMFANEPIACCLQDFCKVHSISEMEMYRLISLAFMKEKLDKLMSKNNLSQV